MSITATAMAVGAGAVAVLGVALYFTGTAYLNERDQRVTLEYTLKLNEAKQAMAEEFQERLTAITEEANGRVAALEASNRDVENGYKMELLNARDRAAQKPVEFGDAVLRDFIRVDCLWNAGATAADPGVRSACGDEAAHADPARAGISFVALTPDFLAGWRDACEDWPRVGTGEDDLEYTLEAWRAEYGSFDPALCRETLVAMTPEAAVFFRSFISNGEQYTARLVEYALEQGRVIDELTARRK